MRQIEAGPIGLEHQWGDPARMHFFAQCNLVIDNDETDRWRFRFRRPDGVLSIPTPWFDAPHQPAEFVWEGFAWEDGQEWPSPAELAAWRADACAPAQDGA